MPFISDNRSPMTSAAGPSLPELPAAPPARSAEPAIVADAAGSALGCVAVGLLHV